MNGLLPHVNTKRVPEYVVTAVAEPEFTDTWHPVSHEALITVLERSVHGAGIGIQDREYSLSESGLRMFGVWQLEKRHDGMAYCIGMRNSMDKSMAIGLVAGTKVFVCDNLAFAGEYVEFRKHTGGLTYEQLEQLCQRGVESIQGQLDKFGQWHTGLRSIAISTPEAERLTFQAMAVGALVPSKFRVFCALYFEAGARYHDETLYGFHGAATELMKGDSLFRVGEKNRKLTGVIDRFIRELH